MADKKTCPHCGKPVPPTALGGICPECMLKAGLAAQTEGPGATGPHGTTVVHPPPTPAEIASLFPQLEILECLGRGGMGVVYKARQPRLNRLVALKILARDKEQDVQFAERFTREAQALARLSHPNIVAVHDFGEAGGHCYLVMEFVDGLNLRQLLQTAKMKPEQALTIVPKICDALQYAHEQAIVHRDIKPENILLDKQGRVKIADFGIAKMLGAEAGQQTLTGAKDAVGTPHYMAPEQIEKPLTVDHRADIYSLGVVFYEMLTGELPLGKFQPPSQKVQVDVRLDEVVLHALEKEPSRRYQQVSQVKTDVETITSTASVLTAASANDASPRLTLSEAGALTREFLARDYVLNIGSCLSRGWSLVRSDFWPAVGVTALILLLQNAADSTLIGLVVGGPLSGGLWWYFLKKIRGEHPNVGTAFSVFSIAFVPLFLAGLVTWLLTVLGLVCLILPGIYLFVAWLFAFPLVVDKRLDYWPAMRISRKVISKHWWKFLWFVIILGLLNLAGLVFCIVGFFIAAPITWAALAYAYEDIIGTVKSPSGTSSSIPPIAPTTPPIPPPDRFWRRFAVVMACVVLTPIAIAIVGLLTAIAIPNFVRARQHSQQLAAQRWTQQGWQLWQAREMDKAAAKFQQAVQLAPDNADAWNGLGWATFNSGKSQEAEKAFQMAILLDTNQPGALNGLGQIYLSQKKYDQAETYLLRAAPQAPAAWYGLTRLYLLEGKFDQAEKWAQKLVDSGQADDLARQMLQAAQTKHLSEGLRFRIEPPPAGSTFTNSVPASTETWSPALAPGEKLDLQKIRDEVKTLMEQGHYEEALQRQIWYFNHALEFGEVNPIRLNFGIMNWAELGRRYPKAKQALIEIRDRDARGFSEGRGYSELFLEIQSLNRELQDDDATLALVKTIYHQDKQLAGQCYYYVQDLLMQKGEYELCLNCIGDPQIRFESYRRSLEMQRETQQRVDEIRKKYPEPVPPRLPGRAFTPPDMGQLATNNFVGQVCRLVEILVATDHKVDAEKIRDEAVGILDDAKLRSAVNDAEQRIQRTNPTPTIDPVTGLPATPGSTTAINPVTGPPMSPGKTGAIDPATGLPVNPAAANGTTNAAVAAEKWLALIDSGNYADSWSETSAVFRSGVTEAAWENSMNAFRKPLGDLVSRKLKSALATTELPGAADGQYVVVQFDSSFTGKKSAIETVTFKLADDGTWKSAGYFIK